jgi:hypothetical protein
LSQVSGQKAHKGRKKDFLEERDGNLWFYTSTLYVQNILNTAPWNIILT